jgi:hypothetical protein
MKRRAAPSRLKDKSKQAFAEKMAVSQPLEKTALMSELLEEPSNEMTSLSIRLSKEDFGAFRKLCEERNVSISHAVRSLMKFYKFVK